MAIWTTQLRKGVIELAVLGALARGEAYGYELLQRLNALDGLALKESTVYPLLARLTKEKLLSVRSAPSELGPPRRYYRLTSQGQARLSEMTDEWEQLQIAVNHFLKKAPGHANH
jgi:PadR family transcriptional regulator PadR